MVVVAAGIITCLFLLSKSYRFFGLWIALTIYMALRIFAGLEPEQDLGSSLAADRPSSSQTKTA